MTLNALKKSVKAYILKTRIQGLNHLKIIEKNTEDKAGNFKKFIFFIFCIFVNIKT